LTHRRPASQATRRRRRAFKYGFIAAYLVGLCTVPFWISLGFQSSPVSAGVADLQDGERGRFEAISWELLSGFSYEFEMAGTLEEASPEALAQRHERLIPDQVRALDGRSVAVRGYVIPVTTTRGRVTRFILAAKNEIGCCFGDGLLMNQWILVEAPGGVDVELRPFMPATALGVLEVGEDVRKGTVMSLYRMRDAALRES